MARHAVPVAFAVAALGCAATTRSRLPPQSALELRQAQSRIVETPDPRLVLKAAINVLQDQGFVIRHADAELGLVTAVTEWRSGRPNKGLRIVKWAAALPTYGASLLLPTGRTEFSVIEAVVNVTPESARVRVRVSLVAKITDREGNLLRVSPVDDPLLYQRFLAGLDKAAFLEREGL
jgi:hypothetical protein